MNQPNIVLIMTDEMRGDCMGIAGHPDVKTPYLDTLAAQGVLYPDSYTSCPSCIAARASLLTGLAPKNHGRVAYQDRVDWDYSHTLAGELSGAGYYTQCVGKMHVHPLRNLMGFHNIELHDGFLHSYRSLNVPMEENQNFADDYCYWLKEQKGVNADLIDTGLECNSWVARPWMYEEQYHPTNWVTTRSIDFLRRRDTRKPFFLMASYVRPHAPFDAPQCYFDMYRNKELTPPARADWDDSFQRPPLSGRTYSSIYGPDDPELLREMQVGYYACVTHVDHQIGRLIQALGDFNVMNNTVIIFTSDHGDQLGDHHFYRKSLPYQGSAHIPMILSGPEHLIGAKRGTVSHELVELRDILPTCVDLAGASVPDWTDGRSMIQVNQNSAPKRAYLHGEHSYGELSNHWIVTQTDKYCWFSQTGREQYFRLDNDPHELHDRIHDPDYADRITELRNILIQELDGREEGYSDGKQLIVGQKPVAMLSYAKTGKKQG